MISRGAISAVELLREPPLSAAARALARGLKGDALLLWLLAVGEASAELTLLAEALPLEPADIVLGPRGTVRLLRFCDEALGDAGLGMNSSGGCSSAAGMGRPRPAQMSWYSVQLSSLSLRPRQNGAILRSIWAKVRQQCGDQSATPVESTHLQLPDNLFVKVFGACICSQRHEVSAIDVLLFERPLAFLFAGDPLALESPGFPLLSCFFSFIGRILSGIRRGAASDS